MVYNRTNLALKDYFYTESPKYKKTEIKKNIQSSAVTSIEKLLYLCSVIVVAFLSFIVLTGYSKLAITNFEIHNIEKNISMLKQQNLQVSLEISTSASEDNIQKFINDKGLVKVSLQPLP